MKSLKLVTCKVIVIRNLNSWSWYFMFTKCVLLKIELCSIEAYFVTCVGWTKSDMCTRVSQSTDKYELIIDFEIVADRISNWKRAIVLHWHSKTNCRFQISVSLEYFPKLILYSRVIKKNINRWRSFINLMNPLFEFVCITPNLDLLSYIMWYVNELSFINFWTII